MRLCRARAQIASIILASARVLHPIGMRKRFSRRSRSCDAAEPVFGFCFGKHGFDVLVHVVERFELRVEGMVRERIVPRRQYLAVLRADDLHQDRPFCPCARPSLRRRSCSLQIPAWCVLLCCMADGTSPASTSRVGVHPEDKNDLHQSKQIEVDHSMI